MKAVSQHTEWRSGIESMEDGVEDSIIELLQLCLHEKVLFDGPVDTCSRQSWVWRSSRGGYLWKLHLALPINWRQCYFLMIRNEPDIRGLTALWWLHKGFVCWAPIVWYQTCWAQEDIHNCPLRGLLPLWTVRWAASFGPIAETNPWSSTRTHKITLDVTCDNLWSEKFEFKSQPNCLPNAA